MSFELRCYVSYSHKEELTKYAMNGISLRELSYLLSSLDIGLLVKWRIVLFERVTWNTLQTALELKLILREQVVSFTPR
jgi:hypothetical protein